MFDNSFGLSVTNFTCVYEAMKASKNSVKIRKNLLNGYCEIVKNEEAIDILAGPNDEVYLGKFFLECMEMNNIKEDDRDVLSKDTLTQMLPYYKKDLASDKNYYCLICNKNLTTIHNISRHFVTVTADKILIQFVSSSEKCKIWRNSHGCYSKRRAKMWTASIRNKVNF